METESTDGIARIFRYFNSKYRLSGDDLRGLDLPSNFEEFRALSPDKFRQYISTVAIEAEASTNMLESSMHEFAISKKKLEIARLNDAIELYSGLNGIMNDFFQRNQTNTKESDDIDVAMNKLYQTLKKVRSGIESKLPKPRAVIFDDEISSFIHGEKFNKKAAQMDHTPGIYSPLLRSTERPSYKITDPDMLERRQSMFRERIKSDGEPMAGDHIATEVVFDVPEAQKTELKRIRTEEVLFTKPEVQKIRLEKKAQEEQDPKKRKQYHEAIDSLMPHVVTTFPSDIRSNKKRKVDDIPLR